ncbi:site-specific integrase [Desulfobacter hydrogenophilus]|uniref:site-specific integrase n=1 Tax=Desulfobacter hydrogenophilus TaxID=2291 RepID=UPI001A9481C2|nr:site-specific integrase [Desulfobacter hydrogenophilus]
MNKNKVLGPWIRRFLLEYLVGERNLAHNTQVSYRDTLVLFLPFTAKNLNKSVD